MAAYTSLGHEFLASLLHSGIEYLCVCVLVDLHKPSLSDLHHCQPTSQTLPHELQVLLYPVCGVGVVCVSREVERGRERERGREGEGGRERGREGEGEGERERECVCVCVGNAANIAGSHACSHVCV